MRCDYIDHVGDDLRVVNAARVSFDKESEWEYFDEEGNIVDKYYASEEDGHITGLKSSDEKLIKYLANHNHWTPFSHCMVTLRETVPIFVARQRFKHMVGFTYNEVSRRYVDDTPEFYVPEVWRSRPEGSVKQGSGTSIVEELIFEDEYSSQPIEEAYEDLIVFCTQTYNTMIKAGVAPEQARMVLPQSMYTSYYCTGSLYAWARAYKLRSDSHAQKEIQDLSKQWDGVIRPLFPVSWSALVD